ncbi:MAG: DUF6602 domain-containing protein [Anaerolineae bacterium]
MAGEKWSYEASEWKMNGQDFNFLEYVNSIEKMMLAWHDYSQEAIKHSVKLGTVREHFIKEVLANFLPKSGVVGSGEITDGNLRSSQQDVIIYRSDFPVLTGFGSVNAYLAEGVIATIEVKSDLSTGTPNGLYSAFKNQATVLALEKRAARARGTQSQFRELQKIHTIKTCVVGYKGWAHKETLLENYRVAGNAVDWQIPDIVYQPNGGIAKNSALAAIRRRDDDQLVPAEDTPLVFLPEHPFAVFFQHPLRAIMTATGGLIAAAPNVSGAMAYDVGHYFNLPKLRCEPIRLFWQHDVDAE